MAAEFFCSMLCFTELNNGVSEMIIHLTPVGINWPPLHFCLFGITKCNQFSSVPVSITETKGEPSSSPQSKKYRESFSNWEFYPTPSRFAISCRDLCPAPEQESDRGKWGKEASASSAEWSMNVSSRNKYVKYCRSEEQTDLSLKFLYGYSLVKRTSIQVLTLFLV